MCSIRLLPLLFLTFTVRSQQHFFPIIRRITGAELDPVGVVFSKLFDHYDISQQRWNRPSKSDEIDDEQLRHIFDQNLGNVADKASDFLEEMLSVVAGRKGEKVSRKPIRPPPIRTSVHGALTLGEHVCVRESKVNVPNGKAVSECTEFGKATRCISGAGNSTLVRIVECCKGYNTTDIRNGCLSVDDMLTVAELASSIDNCMNNTAYKSHLSQVTVLLPPSDTCSAKEDNQEEQLDDRVVDGIFHYYDFLGSQRVRTRSGRYVIVEEGDGYSKLPLLNCVEMEEGEIIATDGIVQRLRHPMSTSSANLFEAISNRSEFGSFVQLLDDNIKKLLTSDSVSTLFAFTDESFSALSHSLQTRMRRHSQCTKDLIKEHIYGGVHCSRRMQGSLESIGGHKHEVSKEVVNGTLFIRVGNARILKTDIITSNGIIHTIDDVILLEEFTDWRDHMAVYEEEFLKLAEQVISNDEEPAAIFVPPRNSFGNLSDEKSFIENHVIPRNEMITNNSIMTSYGSKIPSLFGTRTTSVGCVQMSKPSLRLCKTVIYFITQPLPVVRQNILEVLNTREDVSVFRSILNNSSLAELVDLESDAPYTLIIPSDDALSKNQIKALNRNITLAEKFVRRHIFRGLFCLTQLNMEDDGFDNAELLENLQREYFAVKSIKSGRIVVGGSTIQEKGIVATNGIIHILESPLKAAAPPERYSSLFDTFDL